VSPPAVRRATPCSANGTEFSGGHAWQCLDIPLPAPARPLPVQRSALSSAPWLLLDTRSKQGTLQDLCEEAPDPTPRAPCSTKGRPTSWRATWRRSSKQVRGRTLAPGARAGFCSPAPMGQQTRAEPRRCLVVGASAWQVCSDVCEAEAERVVSCAAGLKPSEIAVQSPYQAQVQLIRSRLQDLAATAAGASAAEAMGAPGRAQAAAASPGRQCWRGLRRWRWPLWTASRAGRRRPWSFPW